MKRNTLAFLSLITSALLVTACGDSSQQQDPAAGLISLNITDAPVDDADAVVIEFSSVIFKSEDDADIEFIFEDDPATDDVDESKKSIDLLALQGVASQSLLENVEIPAGNYTQIRLGVNVVKGVDDSYITFKGDDTRHELQLPSQTGLKLNTPFTIAAGTEGIAVADENSVYTIDFDLRKSIVKPEAVNQDYKLKPVLRLVQNINTGSLSGTIDPALLTGDSCSDDAPLTGNAVYLFAGAGIEVDDVDGLGVEPVTTSLVSYNATSGEYSYEIGFIGEGNYTVAFTCTADQDDELDNLNDTTFDVVFDVVNNVNIMAGKNTEFPIQ